MRPVTLLARLNDVDLLLDQLTIRLAEIERGLRQPQALKLARQQVIETEANSAEARAGQQTLDEVQKEVAEKLARAEKKLYSGQVKEPRELEDLEQDVQQLRRQKAQADERLLESMVALEAANAALDDRKRKMNQLYSVWDKRRKELTEEKKSLMERLPAAQAVQAAARNEAPAEYLALYDGLRGRRGGRAVAALDGEECSACNVSVPPGRLSEARYGDELVYCGNCGRLLWGKEGDY